MRKVTEFGGFNDIESFRVLGKNVGQAMVDFYRNVGQPNSEARKKLLEKMDKFYEKASKNKKTTEKKLQKKGEIAGKNGTGSF